MAFVDTFVCVHKEESWTHQSKHCKSKPRDKEAAAKRPGATRDRSRDALAGSLGVEGGETTRRQREPGVPLAEAVSRRAARKPDGRAACAREGCE